MKNLQYFLSLAGLALLFSCNQVQKTSIKINTSNLKPGKHCYIALFEKDSASLTFEIAANGKIKGELAINYHNADTVAAARQPTAGNFVGEFKGDTLFADYHFTSGKNGREQYINPIALLHKGDTLIMGKGRIYSYLGRTYFDDKTPIEFYKSRFRFVPVDCK
ncbi:MAG: hypothetical protein V4592_19490 [Bacteroidota bacterium]